MDLATYANIAEIFGAVTIVGGAIYAAVQFTESRGRRRDQVSVELFRAFSDSELGRAIALLNDLPDGCTRAEMHDQGPEYEAAALNVAMSFETMGVVAFQRMASFGLLEELTGGMIMAMWRKLEVWVDDRRKEEDHPRFAEWFQWLAERIFEHQRTVNPAFEAHARWKPQGRR